MAISAQRLIKNRERAEASYREMDKARAEQQRGMQIAKFEITSSNKIERNTKTESFQKLTQEREESLLQRRRRLAELYNNEMEDWRAETLSRVETLEDRKARIMERAYALRDARENERRKFVEQCYDDQWRDACDDARLLDSQALTQLMGKERMAQIQEKQQRRQKLTEEENQFVDNWKQQLAAMEQRDLAKQEARRNADHRTQQEIKDQMSINRSKKEEHLSTKRRSEEEELARLRQAIEEEEEVQRQRVQRDRMRGREIREFNETNKYVKEETLKVKKEQDQMLLDYALRKEREANEAEEAKRLATRRAAIQYRKYLEEQMIKEAEDTAFMDEVCKREEERVWKMRDDALQARDDARRALMQQVDEGRQEQIRLKREAIEQEKEEGLRFANKFAGEVRLSLEEEEIAAQQRKEISRENQERLAQQIAIRRHKEELEKQEAYLADKHMQHIERQHKQRLADQAGTVRMHFPNKHSQWYT